MSATTGAPASTLQPCLQRLDLSSNNEFMQPIKQIHNGPDVDAFLSSKAYTDIVTFLLQLNNAMFPRLQCNADGAASTPAGVATWPIEKDETDAASADRDDGTGTATATSQVHYAQPVEKLRALLLKLDGFLEEAPPDKGPRRFGNISFRKWYKLAQERVDGLFQNVLADSALSGMFSQNTSVDTETKSSPFTDPIPEIRAYLMGSFGSEQRLDYGTGHELSFLAFLACLWKLNYFAVDEPGVTERQITLGIFEPYLQLVRKIIKLYNLEPAGTHGVWGLDDHSFIPYIFGSAQFSRPIGENGMVPLEGSLPGAPSPTAVAKAAEVDRYRHTNMYFQAIGFINDVKKGPFWEHSPILWDISGVESGWAKINKGMIKMYIAEVLSKFPVVQHFPFGTLLKWEQDPNAVIQRPLTAHSSTNKSRNQYQHNSTRSAVNSTVSAPLNVPRAAPPLGTQSTTRAPWAAHTSPAANRYQPPASTVNFSASLRAAATGLGRMPSPGNTANSSVHTNSQPSDDTSQMTKAPWAKD